MEKVASAVPLFTMLSPFLNLAARTNSNVTFKRIQASLFDPLISEVSSASTSLTESSVDCPEPTRIQSRLTDPSFRHLVHNSRGDDSQTAITPLELRSLIYQRIFEVASREETRDSNRKKLYAMWKDGMEGAGSLDMDAS
jgi:ribosomal RNA-processing protein 1